MPKASGKLNLDSEQYQALLEKAIDHHNKGQVPEAESIYRTLILSKPEKADPHHLLGILASQTQNYIEAENSLLQAISLDHTNANFHLSLGTTFFNQHKLTSAFEAYQKCLALEPKNIEASIGLANIYDLQGEFHSAIDILAEVINHEPHHYRVLNNLGNLYRKTLDFEKASQYLNQATETVHNQEDSHEIYKNIALLYLELGQVRKAIQWHEEALSIKADAEVLANLYFEYQTICDWEKSTEIAPFLDKYINYNIVANKNPGERPLLNIIRSQDLQRNLTIATAWSQMLASNLVGFQQPFMFDKNNYSGDKIRIGYISNHFRDHPSSHLMLKLFEMHDNNKFETFVYSYGPDDNSDYRNKIKQDCDHFIDIERTSFQESAQRIFKDNIQILIDISGYTMQARPEIVSLKPAPIIVNYLGFPGTTGSPIYDYIIADPTIMPSSNYQYYSETPVIMPSSYQITDNAPQVSSDNVTKASQGLPEDKVILCSFNQMHKITKGLFTQWMNILKTCNNTVLWIYAPIDEAKNNLLKEVSHHQIEHDRIIFADRLSKDKHLARLKLADIALDTLGYNGHTTTSDALFSGVPVITTMGHHFASRVSASLLETFGLPNLITKTEQSYEELITYYCQNNTALVDLKKQVQKLRKTTDLFNTAQFVAQLEKAYSAMWGNYLEQTKETIIVNEK